MGKDSKPLEQREAERDARRLLAALLALMIVPLCGLILIGYVASMGGDGGSSGGSPSPPEQTYEEILRENMIREEKANIRREQEELRDAVQRAWIREEIREGKH